MKESYAEDLANHGGLEPCLDDPQGHGEALAEVRAGGPLSSEIKQTQMSTKSGKGKTTSEMPQSRGKSGSGGVEEPGMHGNFLSGNRETRQAPSPLGNGRVVSEKERSRYTDAYANRESDEVTVPEKLSNKGAPAPAEATEGRTSAKSNVGGEAVDRSQNRKTISFGLEGVRQRAIKDKTQVFTNLKHHIRLELLREAFYDLNRKAVAGIDGVKWQDYEQDLEENLQDLYDRIHRGAYRAKPVLRTYIKKENGTLRPLGITSVEDKLVQQAVVKVLLPIYDADMLGLSYGFRIGKSQHDALDALAYGIMRRRISWILDADIKSFFDEIPHEELLRLINIRVGDPWILRLIRKWLKTGYSEDGVIHRQEIGTPQGSVISPFLANIYLHYVLDLWIKHERTRRNCGDVIIVRYADDFVIGFQYRNTAERCLADMRERFAGFGLKLHQEKTRLIEFGRYAASNRKKRGEGKPETFDFLGFTHICSINRKGYFFLRRKTIRKRLKNKVKETKELMRKRMHRPVVETGKWLASVLRGFAQYYGVPGNSEALYTFRDQIVKSWFKVLRRRSQKGRRLNWKKYLRVVDSYLPRLQTIHPFPEVRFGATT